MKATSANILNDADALERKLNWQLFKQEIAFVWEYEEFPEDLDWAFKGSADYWGCPSFGWWDETNWRPGVPLHTRGGQICRRVFDLWWTEEEIEYVFDETRFWCRSCAVGWNEATKICWVCEQKTGLEHSWFMKMDAISDHPAVLNGVEFDGDTVLRPYTGLDAALTRQLYLYSTATAMGDRVEHEIRVRAPMQPEEFRNSYEEFLANIRQDIRAGEAALGPAERDRLLQQINLSYGLTEL